MGMAQVLKPFWRFEYFYDHTASPPLSGSVPIPLMPVNPNIPALVNPPPVDAFAYDKETRAGTAGYSPRLLAMMPMPRIGSDVLLWIPQIPSVAVDTNFMYVYQPVWRLRTIGDWRRSKKQGAIYRESFGAADTTAGIAGDRFILPAAFGHAVLSGQEMQDAGTGDVPSRMQTSLSIREGIAVSSAWSSLNPAPISSPAGAFGLEAQQGILNPEGSPSRAFTSPMYRPYWMKVMGNELGIYVYKISAPQPTDLVTTYANWAFDYDPATGLCDPTADDIYFSCMFGVGAGVAGYLGGYPNSGVFVMAGTTS